MYMALNIVAHGFEICAMAIEVSRSNKFYSDEIQDVISSEAIVKRPANIHTVLLWFLLLCLLAMDSYGEFRI